MFLPRALAQIGHHEIFTVYTSHGPLDVLSHKLCLRFICHCADPCQWSDQPGTVDADSAGGLAVDSNYVYLVGTTAGTIGPTSQGQRDA